MVSIPLNSKILANIFAMCGNKIYLCNFLYCFYIIISKILANIFAMCGNKIYLCNFLYCCYIISKILANISQCMVTK